MASGALRDTDADGRCEPRVAALRRERGGGSGFDSRSLGTCRPTTCHERYAPAMRFLRRLVIRIEWRLRIGRYRRCRACTLASCAPCVAAIRHDLLT